MQTILNFIDGRLVPAANGRTLEVFEPATGAVYASAPDSGAEDIAAAVASAKKALPGWSATPAAERSRILLRVADLIDANLDRLARAESIDSGKPLSLARSVDIPRAAANFRFFATAILHTRSDLHQTDGAALNYTLRKPVGVCALISPWNLPLYLFTWKVAPALAAGCTGVGKPSEVTPMTAYLLSEILSEAGLPPGVLNIVHGRGPTAGAPLIDHPDIRAISFTGGTSTGAAIAASAAPRFKKLSLELGGKNPNIIFADADMDDAAAHALRAAFTNQGQICLCGSRIFVERPMYERFLERLVAGAQALKVGDPLEDGTQQGAVVSREHHAKISAAVEQARRDGATVRCGGRSPEKPVSSRCAGGYFYLPTVLTDAPIGCAAMQEEIFGPVVTVTPFDTEEEALALANGVRYGLASMIWTRDLDRAHRVASKIDAGVVWINCWMVRDLRTPFGGMKDSGVGREGGDEALRFFTEPRNVCLKLQDRTP